MGIDIRLPIGLMFTIIGLLLAIFGLLSDASIYQRSLGINVNLIWGVLLTLFRGGHAAVGQKASGRVGPVVRLRSRAMVSSRVNHRSIAGDAYGPLRPWVLFFIK